MPPGTLDGTPPPFFRQGPSALTKLLFFSALAVFLMVADVRFRVTQPLRVGVATVMHPLQWLVLQPVVLLREGTQYFDSLEAAQSREEKMRVRMMAIGHRAAQVEALQLENARLRELLGLRGRLTPQGQVAQVLYDAADPYTHKVIIDKGLLDRIQPGSPVLDEHGVLGQVTRVYPMLSEVTLLTDRDQAIPVLNARNGLRGLAFGDPASRDGGLDLRFVSANADVSAGDLLTTSGVDGVYPPGLPVARVVHVDRRADSAFARITCQPLAQTGGVEHVLVLTPLQSVQPRPEMPEAAPVARGKGAGK